MSLMSIISHEEDCCDWYKVAQLIQCGRPCKGLFDNQTDSLCIHRAFFWFHGTVHCYYCSGEYRV